MIVRMKAIQSSNKTANISTIRDLLSRFFSLLFQIQFNSNNFIPITLNAMLFYQRVYMCTVYMNGFLVSASDVSMAYFPDIRNTALIK